MTIKFENYGHFYCSLAYSNNNVIDLRDDAMPHDLRECTDFIEYKMGQDTTIVLGIICDWDTGEVVATIERENEDFADFDPDPDWGYNEDMGFDPYLGCYTDDC